MHMGHNLLVSDLLIRAHCARRHQLPRPLVALGSLVVEGCTPGYWKQPQHLDSWVPTGYDPGQSIYSAFEVGPSDIALLQALKLKGGGWNAFWRHAVAALLNAAHPDVLYIGL